MATHSPVHWFIIINDYDKILSILLHLTGGLDYYSMIYFFFLEILSYMGLFHKKFHDNECEDVDDINSCWYAVIRATSHKLYIYIYICICICLHDKMFTKTLVATLRRLRHVYHKVLLWERKESGLRSEGRKSEVGWWDERVQTTLTRPNEGEPSKRSQVADMWGGPNLRFLSDSFHMVQLTIFYQIYPLRVTGLAIACDRLLLPPAAPVTTIIVGIACLWMQ